MLQMGFGTRNVSKTVSCGNYEYKDHTKTTRDAESERL